MSESLLSFSEVLLFGRLLNDLKIKVAKVNPDKKVTLATREKMPLETDLTIATDLIDGEVVSNSDTVLITGNSSKRNGIYTVAISAGDNSKYQLGNVARVGEDDIIEVEEGADFEKTIWQQTVEKAKANTKQRYRLKKNLSEKLGKNQQLKDQYGEKARLARIYGFSYEGTYYDLPEPTVFLVHGEGESPTDGNKPGNLASRAPNDPSLTGVAAADYQIANDIRVWNYDKADYTIRMDVMSGQFEQVLLDIYFGFDSPAISGAKVSGAKVSGAKVSGAKVSGAKVSGAKVSGAKARGD